jgi:uncharacterized repeat protein (TIGR02543 family)
MDKVRLKLRKVATIAACLAVTTVFASCEKNPDDGNKPTDGDGFKVQFVANGGVTAPADQTVANGGKVSEPSAMTNPNHEDFNGWYTSVDFTGNPYDFNTSVTADLKLYAKWGYKIGDTGPAGGKIFYVKSGATYPDWKYLEASPSELGICRWAWGSFKDGDDEMLAYDYIVDGAKGTAIGTGKANTAAILVMLSFPPFPGSEFVTVPAAKGADDYTSGSYGDWFLPSKDELNALYQSKVLSISGSEHYYWSSSQHDDAGRNQCAWSQCFGTSDPGLQNEENKSHDYRARVRPVRSFFCSH